MLISQLEPYQSGLLGLALLLALVMLQWFVASAAKARQPGAIPGKFPQNLSHDDFIFRAWRTHQNSLENLATMLGAAVLAILSGTDPFWTNLLIGIMVVARVGHTVLYYTIATNKNPSPRSYLFMIAWLANLALLGLSIFNLL